MTQGLREWHLQWLNFVHTTLVDQLTPPVTSDPRDPRSAAGLCVHCPHMHRTHALTGREIHMSTSALRYLNIYEDISLLKTSQQYLHNQLLHENHSFFYLSCKW